MVPPLVERQRVEVGAVQARGGQALGDLPGDRQLSGHEPAYRLTTRLQVLVEQAGVDQRVGADLAHPLLRDAAGRVPVGLPGTRRDQQRGQVVGRGLLVVVEPAPGGQQRHQEYGEGGARRHGVTVARPLPRTPVPGSPTAD